MTARRPGSDALMHDIARWTRLTFGGYALGFLLVLLCIALAGAVGLGESQLPVGLGMGLGVGLVQARVLEERVGDGPRWWRASLYGVALPFIARDVARLFGEHLPIELTGSVILAGLAAGLLQWNLLREHSPRAAWWVPAALAGWSLAGSLAGVDFRIFQGVGGIAGALLYIGVILLGGALLGLVTGPALRWILPAAPAAERAP